MQLATWQSVNNMCHVAHLNVEALPGFDESPITQDDFKAVRALLKEVCPDERTLPLGKALVAWLTAFDVFKRAETQIGLPLSPGSRLVYGGIVAQLKGAGKWLLVILGRNPKVLEHLEIRYEDIASRVKELSWDDDWTENPLSKEDRGRLAAAFGG